MRDRRFIARHRGGPLDPTHHRLLAAWAADCAAHVLPLFTAARPSDPRPQEAIAIARAWSRGELPVGPAQKAAVAAHAAARDAKTPPAIAAARAAGHAVATAHMADHSLGPALYALKAVAAAHASPDAERAWQIKRLPPALGPLVLSALSSDRFNRRPFIRPPNPTIIPLTRSPEPRDGNPRPAATPTHPKQWLLENR